MLIRGKMYMKCEFCFYDSHFPLQKALIISVVKKICMLKSSEENIKW